MGEVRCIECVKAVPAFSCNDLKPGDHVIFCGALYDHHGIILSKKRDNFEIAEATFTVLSFLYGILRGFSFKPFIQITTKKKFDFVKKRYVLPNTSIDTQKAKPFTEPELYILR